MDAIDHRIIAELRKDGRLTNQDLADRVGLSPSPCLRRVRRLEAEGIISGYTARVDLRKYGLPVAAYVRLRLSKHGDTRGIEERLAGIDQVQECYLMAGDHDFLLRVAVDSIDGYERFLREHLHGIADVSSIETNFVMSTVKETGPLPR
ncbi:Lrp/AsnC family transcriptional regulator [Sinomonas halotolerans]|uniref:Lrp/AsnC family transcriptional regulator n=1 Tax=Sinomonas halotolerans TaxID=1644133 RepID=A0ABU9X1V6_9MICC